MPRRVPFSRLKEMLHCTKFVSNAWFANSRAQNVRAKNPRESSCGSSSRMKAPDSGVLINIIQQGVLYSPGNHWRSYLSWLHHGANIQFGDFGRARKAQAIDNDRSHIVRLQQTFRNILTPLMLEDCFLHWCGRASDENTKDPHSIRVEFFAEAISNGFESCLGGGIMADGTARSANN